MPSDPRTRFPGDAGKPGEPAARRGRRLPVFGERHLTAYLAARDTLRRLRSGAADRQPPRLPEV
jgi:hypothetical protein